MDNKYDRELRDYRDTKNKAEAYERRKAKQPVDITLDELKMSHHNHYIDHQNKMVEEELIELINERGK